MFVFAIPDEMFFKAESELNAVIAELGESAPMTMPSTAYYLACIYAYLGEKLHASESGRTGTGCENEADPDPRTDRGQKPALRG